MKFNNIHNSLREPAKIAARKADELQGIFLNILEINEPVYSKQSKGDPYFTLVDVKKKIEEILDRNIEITEFADLYAQVITIGIFSARLIDPFFRPFTEANAIKLISDHSIHFQQFFDSFKNLEICNEAVSVVNSLCEDLEKINLENLLSDFEHMANHDSPFVYLYEVFLSEYNKDLKKSRGVWYTPEAVVSFMVRTTDEILKKKFNLNSLASDEKITIGGSIFNKVQIIDLSMGSGVFFAEIIKLIYQYIDPNAYESHSKDKNSVPGLYGFELLPVSYFICYLKLNLLIHEWCKINFEQKNLIEFKIFAGNVLEDQASFEGKLPFLSKNQIKSTCEGDPRSDLPLQNNPILIFIGNPPYSGISRNTNDWVKALVKEYKYVEGIHIGERKHWLNDDYVKFIRLAEYQIEKNGEGILAYVTNHAYLDNPTFRGMRWKLMQTFDEIYILDLHGNSKKKEKAPDGTPDRNVFDIQQGVSIMFAVKNKNLTEKKQCKIFHTELFGSRNSKYEILSKSTLNDLEFTEIKPKAPFYFFIPQNDFHHLEYENGFSIKELFDLNTTGIVTARDHLSIDFTKIELLNKINIFFDPEKTDSEIRDEFYPNKRDSSKYLKGDTRSWKLSETRAQIRNHDHLQNFETISYRPFDERTIYYCDEMIDWGRRKVMSHMQKGPNIGLITVRQVAEGNFNHAFVTRKIAESRMTISNKGIAYLFPLYRFIEKINAEGVKEIIRIPNLQKTIIDRFAEKIGLEPDDLDPEEILDYVYGMLHHPVYRVRYAEYLKSDFPRVPYPKEKTKFVSIAEMGKELKNWHLLEHPGINDSITSFPEKGNNQVTGLKYLNTRLWINSLQYFDGIPEEVWKFSMGGYQPAQKWLKDRKGRILTAEELIHYQHIIKSLLSTIQIMNELEKIDFWQPEEDAK